MAGTEQPGVKPNGFALTDDQLVKLRKSWSEPAKQEQAVKNAEPLDTEALEQPQRGLKGDLLQQRLIELLDQRNQQRRNIFNLAKWYCWVSLTFLIVIVAIQILFRVLDPDSGFTVFDGNELEVIVLGVFGQFVGLLYVITKSLYDDKNYKELFKKGVGAGN